MSSIPSGRTFAAVVADAKDEFKDFVQTRFELLKVEIQEKSKLLKVAALLAAIAIIVLVTAYLLLTIALVALVAAALAGNPNHWVFGFLAVGALWAILGGLAAYFAKREFALRGVVPNRTIAVLKGDKVWIQSEAKNQS